MFDLFKFDVYFCCVDYMVVGLVLEVEFDIWVEILV